MELQLRKDPRRFQKSGQLNKGEGFGSEISEFKAAGQDGRTGSSGLTHLGIMRRERHVINPHPLTLTGRLALSHLTSFSLPSCVFLLLCLGFVLFFRGMGGVVF